jgi:transcriptional regulator with XRE-family HTH domain
VSDLGTYLRARRHAVDPEQVGLARGRRQVQGLRREEVATLAAISSDYYTRLEQGRETHPSAQLLDALARVLQLDTEERLHLFRLAGADPNARASLGATAVSEPTRALLQRWSSTPAFVYNDAQDILAANDLGRALHGGFSVRDNFARMIFLDPEGARFFVDWEQIALATAASLRQAWGKRYSRAAVQSLVDELRRAGDTFEPLWNTHHVVDKSHHTKTLHHPAVGRLILDYHTFDVPAARDQHLLVCDAPAGSASDAALRRLAESVSADHTAEPSSRR